VASQLTPQLTPSLNSAGFMRLSSSSGKNIHHVTVIACSTALGAEEIGDFFSDAVKTGSKQALGDSISF